MYYGTSPIVTNGLVGYFDTSNPISYTSGSLIWKDLTNTCDLILTGSNLLPKYWIGSREVIPSIATYYYNIPYSNNFTNAFWNKNVTGYTSTVTASVIAAPPGMPGSGSKLNETTINSYHGISTSRQLAIGETVNISFYAKPAERTWIRYYDYAWMGYYVSIDLVNGVTGSKNVGPLDRNGISSTISNILIEDAGDGWKKCSLDFTTAYDSMNFGIYTALNNATASYVGDPTSGVYIYGASIVYGSPPYTYLDTSTFSNINLSSSYLEYTGSAIQENNVHSVFMWVKGFLSLFGNNAVYSKYSDTGQGFTCQVQTDIFAFANNATSRYTTNLESRFGSSRPFTAHGWSQIGIVRSSTETRFYWNGVRISTQGKATLSTSSATVKFGANVGMNLAATYNSYAGLGFGNILIYNREVTDAEAMQNFNALKTRFRLNSPQQQFGLRTTTIP